MTSLRRTTASCLALLVAASISSRAAADEPKPETPADPTVAEAREHFNRAQSLYDSGHATAALLELERAYAVKPNYRLLYNLGELAFASHAYVASQRYFEQYVKESSPENDAAKRHEAENMLITLRALVGEVDVHVNVAGATISIDDEVIGTMPLASAPQVSAGRHKVTVSKEGYHPYTAAITVLGGEATSTEIKLDRIVSQVIVAGGPDRTPSRWTVLSWTGVGASAALAGTATYFALASANASSKLSSIEYAGATPSQDYRDQEAKVTHDRTIALVLGGASALTLATTLFFTLTKGSAEAPKPAHTTGTNIGVTPNGVVMTGSFE